MANADYTYDQIRDGKVNASFKEESGFSASVRRLQMKLNRHGISVGTPDGYYGKNTTSAVKQFQEKYSLNITGEATRGTLIQLDAVSTDTAVELLGRELTHSEIINGYGTLSAVEALARCIYGEYAIAGEGMNAVAREIYNRKSAPQFRFDTFHPTSPTWDGIVYSKRQYAALTGGTGDTKLARQPDQYSTNWAYAVALAQQLVSGQIPDSTLGLRYFHLSRYSSYPADSYNHIQIPSNIGNKFFNNATTKF